ncbi:MAG: phosphatase PAP2 family protein [Bacteroidetes bacterium]|nr:phosphatase PAP2 family protein [Bacteroidota bacterium]MBS1974694.1 phosphatase PAP2 family protein [Bacteroidota bacterium]
MILLEGSGHLGFLQHILHIDYWLFEKINGQWTSPFFDAAFPFLREAEFWLPFYLFLLVFALLNFGKKAIWWCLGLIMTAIISDLVSSSVIKQSIFRYRPCQDPVIGEKIRVLVKYCPHSSSFTSSHACNHFSAAMFIFMTIGHTSKWWALVYLWAFVISYAQVYVGVHYPLDILGGTTVGCLLGYGMSVFFKKQFGLPGTINTMV